MHMSVTEICTGDVDQTKHKGCSAHPRLWARRELPSSRQTTLLETLAAAASLLTAAEKTRPGAGPPPLLSFLRPLRPAPHLAAQTIDFAAVRGPAEQASINQLALPRLWPTEHACVYGSYIVTRRQCWHPV